MAGRVLQRSLARGPSLGLGLLLRTDFGLRHQHSLHPLFADPETAPVSPKVHDSFDAAKPDAAADTLYGKTNVFVREARTHLPRLCTTRLNAALCPLCSRCASSRRCQHKGQAQAAVGCWRTAVCLDVPRRARALQGFASRICGARQALRELDYPERLQKMLLTPQREVHVELIITRDRWPRAPSVHLCSARPCCKGLCNLRPRQALPSMQVFINPGAGDLASKVHNEHSCLTVVNAATGWAWHSTRKRQALRARAQRRDRGVQRLPRAARQLARAVQGRLPLPP
jgi:hypothetical protein